MLLAVDIGNSNIVMAIFYQNKWNHQWRGETEPGRGIKALESDIRIFFRKAAVSPEAVSKVIIGSVVPRLTHITARVCENLTGKKALILDTFIDTGIIIDREEVGADLIADAVAAYDRYKRNVIIIDFGTATTVMVVKEPGVLVGGAICSGLKVTHDALVGKAALLPGIPLEVPDHVIGRGTTEAMQSGIVLGHLYMVEGLVSRMMEELGEAKVIATGGFATVFVPHSNCFDDMDPMLTLNGLRIIAERQSSDGFE